MTVAATQMTTRDFGDMFASLLAGGWSRRDGAPQKVCPVFAKRRKSHSGRVGSNDSSSRQLDAVGAMPLADKAQAVTICRPQIGSAHQKYRAARSMTDWSITS
jgi:hypothetical protein